MCHDGVIRTHCHCSFSSEEDFVLLHDLHRPLVTFLWLVFFLSEVTNACNASFVALTFFFVPTATSRSQWVQAQCGGTEEHSDKSPWKQDASGIFTPIGAVSTLCHAVDAKHKFHQAKRYSMCRVSGDG